MTIFLLNYLVELKMVELKIHVSALIRSSYLFVVISVGYSSIKNSVITLTVTKTINISLTSHMYKYLIFDGQFTTAVVTFMITIVDL